MSLFAPNTKVDQPKKPAGLDESDFNSNQEAIPVPYLAGRRRVALTWFTPAYNQVNEPVKQTVGKGDKQTVGYIYYVDLAGLICMGGRRPLDKLFKHIIEKEILWRNDSGLARGGADYEPVSVSGFASTVIKWGRDDQTVDTLVLTPRGTITGGINPRDTLTWPGSDWHNQHPEP